MRQQNVVKNVINERNKYMTNHSCDCCMKATETTDRVYKLALDTVTDILGEAGFELVEFILEGSGITAGFAVIDTESQEVVIPAIIREGEYEDPVSLDAVIEWAMENNLCLKKR